MHVFEIVPLPLYHTVSDLERSCLCAVTMKTDCSKPGNTCPCDNAATSLLEILISCSNNPDWLQ